MTFRLPIFIKVILFLEFWASLLVFIVANTSRTRWVDLNIVVCVCLFDRTTARWYIKKVLIEKKANRWYGTINSIFSAFFKNNFDGNEFWRKMVCMQWYFMFGARISKLLRNIDGSFMIKWDRIIKKGRIEKKVIGCL